MDYIERRSLDEAAFIIENNATIRQTAIYSGVSKSTVHTDMSKQLKRIDAALYAAVKNVLETNMAEAHLRGGEVTKIKFLKKV